MKSEREVAQSCPTLSDPMDCSLPGSSVHGIFQARVLEWVTRAFSDLVYWGVIKKTVIICTAKGAINLDFRPYVKYLKTELQRHLGT